MKFSVKKSIIALICALMLALSLITVTACGGGIKITLDYNYDGASTKTVSVSEGEKLEKPADPTRDGWTFDGWYTDADCTYPYDFENTVSEAFTLYASWLDPNKEYVTVTFDYNYAGATASGTQRVEKGTKVTKPETPVREADDMTESATFKTWTLDALGSEEFDFDTVINEDTTLYANWSTKYVFEAEYVYLDDIENGAGFSGQGVRGKNLVVRDTTGSGKASNGFFVSYLYSEGITLEFEIESDRDVKGAKLILRLSCEVMDIVINGGNYNVIVNDTNYSYSDIQLKDPAKDIFNGEVKEFADFEITPFLQLKEGKNTIKLVTANSTPMQGTMYATAPMVDCIKIETDANLSWEPVTSNIVGK